MVTFKGLCPVCDAVMHLAGDTEESEIVICPDCQTRLVAGALSGDSFALTKAPEIEEDWGQ